MKMVYGSRNFEDGLPTNGLVYYTPDGGGMTFSVANDNALLGSSYFRMGGRVNWDWALGSIDLPIDITNVSQASDDLYINIEYYLIFKTYIRVNL